MHRNPILAYIFELRRMSAKTFAVPNPLQVNSVESQSRFSSAPTLPPVWKFTQSTHFQLYLFGNLKLDLRTAWISYFPRVGPCNLEKMCAIEMHFSVNLLGFVNTIDLGTSPLTIYFEKQARSNDTCLKQPLHDKVTSFLKQFLQVVAVQGHQTRPACKMQHALNHQGCMNCFELLTCP